MEASLKEAPRPAATLAQLTADPGAENGTPGTIRLGGIEVGLPPDSADPMSVMHYITKNRSELWRISQTFYLGKLVPTAILKMDDPMAAVAAVFTILSSGLELGLGYAAALRTIYVVEGRATLSSDLMRGLAMQAGCKFRYLVRTAKECQVEVSRDGSVVGIGKFTIEQAQTAGLTGKNNWKGYPEAMLAARAGAIAARMGAPDRLAGLYTPDELDGGLDGDDAANVGALRQLPDPVRDAAMGEQVRIESAARTDAVNAAHGFQPKAPEAPQPAGMSHEQRGKLMAMVTKLKMKGEGERDGKIHTVIHTDDEINRALKLPEGENLWLADINKGMAIVLIDILEKREAQRAEEQTREDASEALGGAE